MQNTSLAGEIDCMGGGSPKSKGVAACQGRRKHAPGIKGTVITALSRARPTRMDCEISQEIFANHGRSSKPWCHQQERAAVLARKTTEVCLFDFRVKSAPARGKRLGIALGHLGAMLGLI